ncbi:MAG: family 43 glycosylhydrolase [Niabella sp.]|nr:family 43 glycosylhydrolase [Niabella sp.]
MKSFLFLLLTSFSFYACKKASIPSLPTDASAASGFSLAAASPTGTLTDSGIYRIRALACQPAGPVVEVTGNTTTEGAQIQQWSWFPNNGQKWKLVKVDTTYWKLVNLTSAKCLEAPSASEWAILQQGTDDGTDLQRWRIDHTGDNFYTLTNKATGMKAVLGTDDSVPGRKIRQTASVTGTADRFEFHNLYFKNPVINGGRPDPYVAERNGYYYFLSTKGNRITIIKTPDMSLLNAMPEITVWTPPTGTAYSSHIWAPELHFLDGKWYIYFAADDGADDNHRMFVLENANADPTTGTWVVKGKITDASDQWAIDGTVLTIGSSRWFVWSGWENLATKFKQYIYIASMSNPWTITGARVKISSPTNNWEKYEGDGSLGLGVNEGPIILRKDASSPVCLIFSASRYNSDNYCLAQIQLTPGADPKLASSWTNKKQVFVKSTANSVYGPGHNGFFTSSYTDPNNIVHTDNWLVYHARSTANTPGGTRTARMQSFSWNADGTPNFGVPVKTGTDLPVPIGE